MIIFDIESRLFSVVEDREFGLIHNKPGKGLSYATAMGLGGMGNVVYQGYKKKKYIQELIDKGEDPVKAKFKADQRFGGLAKQAAVGTALGAGALHGARLLRRAGSELGVK